MRILVLSDLHLEFSPLSMGPFEADVVVLAGDIHTGTKGIAWAKEQFPKHPVLYVLGNHEYYKQAYPRLLDKIREEAMDSNVRVLEDCSEVIDGVHFHGCTLWTDLNLFGDEYLAAEEVSSALRDYRKIRYGARFRRLTPGHTKEIHSYSVAWLASALQDRSQRHVVITHHAPSVNSVPAHLKAHKLTPGYASNLESLVARLSPDLWIHGHVHHQSDYVLGTTRIVCNPRGYPDEEIAGFREDFTVTV